MLGQVDRQDDPRRKKVVLQIEQEVGEEQVLHSVGQA